MLRDAKVPNSNAVLSLSRCRRSAPKPAPARCRVPRRRARSGRPGAHLVLKMGACYLLGMRIIARRTLRQFVGSRAGHRDQQALKGALDAWFAEVRKAKWSNSADVKRLYASASIVSSDRIVFNVRGNAYRLAVAVDFEKGIVWIKWLGTHRDYDRIDVKELDLG
jgi:mRNA interferase HigB